ncbi:MAG: 16S rRNA (cytidine(1402)-2'-O)-methyltransferase [Dethiobacter sp.]|nr:16S rRNA (cytidine(1402)-2'-O)-methyltransferase [Dethiobacter sp.]MBS3899052.1 16S rRNA (cytidine(1402)-2'-O)-methyltransferase [Dethiobacter sp.]MBS3982605.1 16S rRNA (cytidine(1402)-2'-O)-methyltransferase [Dethiobacter sp.]MCL4463925.1 16S rRNA (cytidine(1402)-2'-O)-methyltransferase [Bacillota bacterium]MCL5993258.1 16S rRNA (cytidine(1402)-2'-O)-methyltransferase [Bacillota bacterium]
MNPGTLYLCPTPLGNMEDITLRVLRILGEADKIAAEDTRRTRKLLSHFKIHTPLTSYHEHNKHKKGAVILAWLQAGLCVALVSDAGTPGIADPGEDLVKDALNHGIQVVSLPGPVAAVTALVASGLPSVPFAFYGFLPARGSERKMIVSRILGEDKTVVFYEAPHRLVKTLTELQADEQSRQVVVARELTKVYEQFVRGTLTEVQAHFSLNEPRGECTVLLAGKGKKPCLAEPVALVEDLLKEGLTKKEAIREAANRLKLPRNDVYKRVLAKK